MFHHHVVDGCLTFLNDVGRNRWYRRHLAEVARGRVVFEIGCGAGILAAYALESGCQHYYGVDIKSDRAKFTANILDRLGYQGRHTVWCADAAAMTPQDLPQNIDILICEQTGHQMQSNFTIQQFWNNLIPMIPSVTSLPDAWHMDAYVYDGMLDSDLPEYQPKVLLADKELPVGYLEAVSDTDFVKPRDIILDAITVTADLFDRDLEFDLDLSTYDSATVVLQDHISFRGDVCPSSSALTDWPIPTRILIPRARGRFRFRWDSEQRRAPEFNRGFWTWEKVSG